MEVEEADEGILALVVPPVGDVTLNRKVIRDIQSIRLANYKHCSMSKDYCSKIIYASTTIFQISGAKGGSNFHGEIRPPPQKKQKKNKKKQKNKKNNMGAMREPQLFHFNSIL